MQPSRSVNRTTLANTTLRESGEMQRERERERESDSYRRGQKEVSILPPISRGKFAGRVGRTSVRPSFFTRGRKKARGGEGEGRGGMRDDRRSARITLPRGTCRYSPRKNEDECRLRGQDKWASRAWRREERERGGGKGLSAERRQEIREREEEERDGGLIFSVLAESGVITDLPRASSSRSRLLREYKCRATGPDGEAATQWRHGRTSRDKCDVSARNASRDFEAADVIAFVTRRCDM